MEDNTLSKSNLSSYSTCASLLHENLEDFLSAANRKVLELKKENEALQNKVRLLKSSKTKCGKCSESYSTFSHLFQPDHVKIKQQLNVIELKFPNTEAVINYIKVSPSLQINNIDKFHDKNSAKDF
uniref:Uncharacterized protein n=1 Tax=Strongyloides stercoralis TaxID=6248 RepID=A0A0K0DUN3_STRER